MSEHPPVPPDAYALAAHVGSLAEQVDRLDKLLSGAGDETMRYAGWRLDESVAVLRQVAGDLRATGRDLDYIREVRSRPHCGAEWGCCPEHGNTLSGTGGECRCTERGCGRTWDASRMTLPCGDPPAYRLRSAAGTEGLVCLGHAIDASRALTGAHLLPLTPEVER